MSHVVKHLSLSPLHIYYKINTDFEQLFLYIHFYHYLNSCVYTLSTNSGSIQIKLPLEEKQIKPAKTLQASTHTVFTYPVLELGSVWCFSLEGTKIGRAPLTTGTAKKLPSG